MRSPALPGIAIGALVACGRLAFDPASEVEEIADAAVVSCPAGAGYDSYPGLAHRYRALGQMNYATARALCAAEGTQLITIDEADEGAKIAEISMGGSAWAGVENVDGEWRRQDGERATYLPWDSNQPAIEAAGAVVQLYATQKFHTDPDGNYEWLTYCECASR